MTTFPIASGAGSGVPANTPLPGVAALDASQSYLGVAEADRYIELVMLGTDHARLAWNRLGEGDKAACLRMATMHIDAIAWRDEVVDCDQPLRWPRRERGTGRPIGGASPMVADPLVPGAPNAVRIGCAHQAAHLAALQHGLSPARVVEEMAAKGVTAQSSMGRSISVDLRTANHAWARLCPQAQTVLKQLRWRGSEVL